MNLPNAKEREEEHEQGLEHEHGQGQEQEQEQEQENNDTKTTINIAVIVNCMYLDGDPLKKTFKLKQKTYRFKKIIYWLKRTEESK